MQRDDITIERLERALVAMAYIVVRHGEAYAPILDQIERDLEDLRRQAAPVERARRLLEVYTVSGGRNAIRESQSLVSSSCGPRP